MVRTVFPSPPTRTSGAEQDRHPVHAGARRRREALTVRRDPSEAVRAPLGPAPR